ncbi:MAG TPA: restriction endonuclease [Candidatus Saccharimonadales bacterium]|nr:restriction endonuclease [Candidatus Saccharimonadales bacterium]
MSRSRVVSLDFVLAELLGLSICAGALLYCGKEPRGYIVAAAGLGVCATAAIWKTRAGATHLQPSQTAFLRKQQPDSAAIQQVARPLTAKERLSALDWYQFKRLVAVLYEQKNYVIRRSNRIDDLQRIDFALELGSIQLGVICKHWKCWIVSVKHIQDFAEDLKRAGLSHGRFVALKDFSVDAQAFAAKSNIQLVDGNEIVRMMSEVNWESNPALLGVMEDKRKLCPLCNSEMYIKSCLPETAVGQEFWECRTAPLCRGTIVSD